MHKKVERLVEALHLGSVFNGVIYVLFAGREDYDAVPVVGAVRLGIAAE